MRLFAFAIRQNMPVYLDRTAPVLIRTQVFVRCGIQTECLECAVLNTQKQEHVPIQRVSFLTILVMNTAAH